jgi:hypothetical protein
MIERLKGFPDNVVAFRASGEVTKQDYNEVLIPAVEKALNSRDKVRILYELGPDFDGYDASAAWEDFKVGVEHLSRWERIAVITDVEWIGLATRLFSVFLPGTIRVYPHAEAAKARLWITQAS